MMTIKDTRYAIPKRLLEPEPGSVIGQQLAALVTERDRLRAVNAALVEAGLTPSEIRAAFVQAESPPESSVRLFLPPVFEVGNGLGQASPFLP
jgi:hypothetical protein